jgi:hypothetical protein
MGLSGFCSNEERAKLQVGGAICPDKAYRRVIAGQRAGIVESPREKMRKDREKKQCCGNSLRPGKLGHSGAVPLHGLGGRSIMVGRLGSITSRAFPVPESSNCVEPKLRFVVNSTGDLYSQGQSGLGGGGGGRGTGLTSRCLKACR